MSSLIKDAHLTDKYMQSHIPEEYTTVLRIELRNNFFCKLILSYEFSWNNKTVFLQGKFFPIEKIVQAELMACSFLYFSWSLYLDRHDYWVQLEPSSYTSVSHAMVPFVRVNSTLLKSRVENQLNGPPLEYLAGSTSHSNTFKWN